MRKNSKIDSNDKRVQLGIALPKSLVDKMDRYLRIDKEGKIPRTRYILDLVKKDLKNK